MSLNLQILMLSLKRKLSRDYKLFDENHDLKTKWNWIKKTKLLFFILYSLLSLANNHQFVRKSPNKTIMIRSTLKNFYLKNQNTTNWKVKALTKCLC